MKFNVSKSHEVWLSKTRQLLRLSWLQIHPKYFLPNTKKRSNEAVLIQQTGGVTEEKPQDVVDDVDSEVNICVSCKAVRVSDDLLESFTVNPDTKW